MLGSFSSRKFVQTLINAKYYRQYWYSESISSSPRSFNYVLLKLLTHDYRIIRETLSPRIYSSNKKLRNYYYYQLFYQSVPIGITVMCQWSHDGISNRYIVYKAIHLENTKHELNTRTHQQVFSSFWVLGNAQAFPLLDVEHNMKLLKPN